MIVLVAWHYAARSQRSPWTGDFEAMLLALAHHTASFLRGMVPLLPANDLVALGSVAMLTIVLFATASPWSRFLLLWTLVAMLPYALMTHGARFAYFCDGPAVLFAVSYASELARRRGWRPSWCSAFWFSLAIAALPRLQTSLAEHRERGAECERVWQHVAEHGLHRRPELLVDAVPLSLANGFEAMLELYGGVRPRVVHLQVLPRPPFLVFVNAAFGELPPSTPVLLLGSVAEPKTTTKQDLVGSLVPVPLLSFVSDYAVVDVVAVSAALQRADQSLATRPLLHERPPCDPQPPGAHHVGELALDVRGSNCTVECERPALLLIASPVPIELLPPGGVLVDGRPVPVQRANGVFHAVCVPAGRHVITLMPAVAGS